VKPRLRVDEFDYCLPPELIAQDPIPDRDQSRLLVLDRRDGSISHKRFYQVKEYLEPGDVLVVNDTRVIPARLRGKRKTGGKAEVLLLKDLDGDNWECLVKPGHKTRKGDDLFFSKNGVELVGRVLSWTGYGGRVIHWSYQGKWEDVLARAGEMPLPPYVKKPLGDPSRYQTVYARAPGSAAAPTAGLHFTPALLDEIRGIGCAVVPVTLNVGLGTFRPVRVETVEAHEMHAEYFQVPEETADAVNRARDAGKKLYGVGTTVVRTLESSAGAGGKAHPGSGDTDLFIYPGYRFQVIDRLITNFHLPKSTLLMLVSAFAGKDLVMKAYEEAVREGYRFYSFGDAMLIL
jgi:S-adenosylmethionine:tRNA ribosyltransferase-isomerase